MEPRFLVDQLGHLVTAEAQPSPLLGRTGTFRLLPTSPDLLLLVRTPAQGGVQAHRPRVVLAGDAGAFPLSDLIAFLGQARWTGALKLATPGAERTLLIKDGEVRSASSDQVGDRLGEIMVRMGYLEPEVLHRVLDEAPPSRLGKVLVERNLVKSHDLYRCLNEQVAEIFHAMMLAKGGSFTLVDQEIEEKALTHNISLSMQGLLMDSIRKIDELAQFRKKIPNGRFKVVRRKPTDGRLEPEEDALLGFVDGRRSVLDLGQAMKVSEFEATRIVYRLIEGGYVQLGSPSVSPPPSSHPSPPVFAPLVPSPPAPIAPPPPSAPSLRAPVIGLASTLDERNVLNVFNVIFREVRDEVARRGNLDQFLSAANASLKGNGVTTSPVLNGLGFREDGTLDGSRVVAQYQRLRAEGQMGSEPLVSLKQALSDVMFFLLFQAGEMLESRADEDLARRVKELLATLDSR